MRDLSDADVLLWAAVLCSLISVACSLTSLALSFRALGVW